MALSRQHTWISGEVLSASDLNAEFDNILNNATTLISPVTSTLDLNGNILTIDADGDSTLREVSDDLVALRLQGFDAFRFDGDVSTPVNGLNFKSAATGTTASIEGQGSDSNLGLFLGDSNGNEILKCAAVASAVNELTATNAATGNSPSLSATGGDTNISINLVPKGTGDVLINGESLALYVQVFG